jgi:hypothetical protein
MKLLKAFAITIILLVISQAAPAQTYDAVKDFTIQSNPNGVWSYGYITSWGTPFTLYTWGGTGGACTPGTSVWSEPPGCPTPSPVVSRNNTNKQICGTTWCIPTSYLGVGPGPNCELNVTRWTAPSSGSFMMRVKFVGLDWAYPTSTYAYVVVNSKRLLLQAPITSYEWPLSFNPQTLRLSAGDTIDLLVGCGKNNSYFGDSTGVWARIWSVGQH